MQEYKLQVQTSVQLQSKIKAETSKVVQQCSITISIYSISMTVSVAQCSNSKLHTIKQISDFVHVNLEVWNLLTQKCWK